MFSITDFISDCSGVLSNDEEPVYQTNSRLARLYDKEFSPRETWKDLAANCVGAMRAIGVEAPADEIYANFKRFYRQVRGEGIRPYIYDDVASTLKELKRRGVRLHVVSSHPHEELLEDLKSISHYFDTISGEHDGYHKKAEAIRLISKDGKAAYGGDMSFDIKAGKLAGVTTFAFTTGYHSREMLDIEKPDRIFDSFSELLDHVF